MPRLLVIRYADDLRSVVADTNEFLAMQRCDSASVRTRIAFSVFG